MTAESTGAGDPLAHVRAHNPHAGQGAVVLDIGDGVGALVVTMPESMVGEEVDIEATDAEIDATLRREHGHHGPHGHHRPHVAVLPRPVPGGGEVASLVFPALPEGEYRLFAKGSDEVVMILGVVGGRVTTESWPDQSSTH